MIVHVGPFISTRPTAGRLKQRADRTVESKAERIRTDDATEIGKHIWDSCGALMNSRNCPL